MILIEEIYIKTAQIVRTFEQLINQSIFISLLENKQNDIDLIENHFRQKNVSEENKYKIVTIKHR